MTTVFNGMIGVFSSIFFFFFGLQLVATTVENMLLFDMGLCNSFPFLIIAALTGIPNEHNRNETLSLTPIQASWLGKQHLKHILIGN